MKEEIEQLIESYKLKIKYTNGLITQTKKVGELNRLYTKKNEYRAFIVELERILKS